MMRVGCAPNSSRRMLRWWSAGAAMPTPRCPIQQAAAGVAGQQQAARAGQGQVKKNGPSKPVSRTCNALCHALVTPCANVSMLVPHFHKRSFFLGLCGTQTLGFSHPRPHASVALACPCPFRAARKPKRTRSRRTNPRCDHRASEWDGRDGRRGGGGDRETSRGR